MTEISQEDAREAIRLLRLYIWQFGRFCRQMDGTPGYRHDDALALIDRHPAPPPVKPCPYCGSLRIAGMAPPGLAVRCLGCKDCGATGPTSGDFGETAIDMWNRRDRRPDTPPLAERP